MPLEAGRSDATVSRNISEMVRAGHPRNQAIAASYRKAGRGRVGKRKKRRHRRK